MVVWSEKRVDSKNKEIIVFQASDATTRFLRNFFSKNDSPENKT